MFDLTGKTALVTGATGGIGQSIAKTLHNAGATIILSGTRENVLSELASTFSERVYTLPCNLADTEQVEGLIEKAESLAGDIDILICNAGITRDNLALRLKEEDWNTVLAINLSSTFTLNKAAFKRMMKRKWGRIINITSIVGYTGNPGQANYAASKAGMVGMSKSLAAEFAPRGVTVNCIAPGFIETDMTAVLPEKQQEHLKQAIPQGKMGQPDDIANCALYLASNEAGYVTGQTIHVNGGMYMI